MAYQDLLTIIGNDKAEHELGYCAQYSAFTQYNNKSGKDFYDWEEEIAKPELIKLGYKLLSGFITGDGDSFGPLTRYIRVEKDGQKMELMYG